MEKKSKLVYIEILRIIAIAFVMLNHLPFVSNYMEHEGLLHWTYLFSVIFSRMCIPVFFMLSGSLLLPRDESISVLLKKRILRFSILLVGMNLLTYIASALIEYVHGNGLYLSVWDFITRLFAGNVEGAFSLWFLYAYLSLLFVLPVLRPAAKRFGWGEYIFFFVIHFILCSVLPVFNLVAKIGGFKGIALSGHLNFPIAAINCFFYALTGYFIDKRLDIRKIKASTLWLMGIITFIAVGISSVGLHFATDLEGEYPEKYYMVSEYIGGIFVFILMKYLFTERFPKLSEGKIASAVCFVGSLTFGVYLLDPFLKMAIYPAYIRFFGDYAYGLLFCLCWVILSSVVCGAVTFVLKKIPFIKELL